MLPKLLHGDQRRVWGDAGYQGQAEAIHESAPGTQDMTSRRVKTKAGVDRAEKCRNRTKARVAIPSVEKGLRLHSGALSRVEKESRAALRWLCLGKTSTRTANGRPRQTSEWPSKGA